MRNVFSDLTRLPASYSLGDLVISRDAGPLLSGVGRELKEDALDFFSDPMWVKNGWAPEESYKSLTTKGGLMELCGYHLSVTPARADYWAMTQTPVPRLVGHVSLDAVQADSDLRCLPSAYGVALIGIHVFPSSRGKGWGSQMTLAAVDLALRNGVGAICAETTRDNIASQRSLNQAGLVYLGEGPVSAATADELGSEVAVRFMALATKRKPSMKDWPFLPRVAKPAVA